MTIKSGDAGRIMTQGDDGVPHYGPVVLLTVIRICSRRKPVIHDGELSVRINSVIP